jgi:hypothetical protein
MFSKARRSHKHYGEPNNRYHAAAANWRLTQSMYQHRRFNSLGLMPSVAAIW